MPGIQRHFNAALFREADLPRGQLFGLLYKYQAHLKSPTVRTQGGVWLTLTAACPVKMQEIAKIVARLMSKTANIL